MENVLDQQIIVFLHIFEVGSLKSLWNMDRSLNLVYIDMLIYSFSNNCDTSNIYREKLLQILLHTGIFGG